MDHDYAKDLSILQASTRKETENKENVQSPVTNSVPADKGNVKSNSTLQCKMCDETFGKPNDLYNHWQQYHQNVLGCKFCGKTVQTKSQLTVSISQTCIELYIQSNVFHIF